MNSLLTQCSYQPTFTVLTDIFVNTIIYMFCPHMFMLLPDADTCQEEIKLQKLFTVSNSVHCLSTALRQYITIVRSV